MSYYIQCDCGKKLTKKPMKTLRCPRCGSVYKKSKKFLCTIHICSFLIILFGFLLYLDADLGTKLLCGISMYLVLALATDIDILDIAILLCGFFIFYYLSQRYDEPLITGAIAILFCVGVAAIFVIFFPYRKQ